MNRLLTFFLSLFFCLSSYAEEYGAYLMVYHKDQDHGLHMAYSEDGYTWTALNDDKPVIAGDTIAQQHGIRDPHIHRGKDGAFYMAMTDLHVFGIRDGIRKTEWERDGKRYGWGNNRGMVFMKSTDLIHWTHRVIDFTEFPSQQYIVDGDTLTMDWKEMGCAWAPETVFDDEEGKMMVHFTTRQGAEKNTIWYVYMNDAFDAVIGQPHFLAAAPKLRYNIIDSDIIRVGDTYHMFYVSHESGATPKHATAQRITGPYKFDDLYFDGERRGHEAPNCWKRLNSDTYVVMFDNFRMKPMNFGFVETKDFFTYKPIGYFDDGKCPMKRTNFMEQKHGAVTYITKKELKRLKDHFAALNKTEKGWVTITNGKAWYDDKGRMVQAHAPGFLYRNGIWYMCGEDRSGSYNPDVNLYSSRDLVNWTFEAKIVENGVTDPLLGSQRMIERAKLLYSETTKKYTVWCHWESRDYSASEAACFEADKIQGPYRKVWSGRPMGIKSRDCNVFTDDDGQAYFISTTEENQHLGLFRLSPDALTPVEHTQLMPHLQREAPAIVKIGSRYHMFSSACTGWAPNQCKISHADNLKGPWTPLEDIGDRVAFRTQAAAILTIKGTKQTTYLYVGDRWQDPDLPNSKIIIFPVSFDGDKCDFQYRQSFQINLKTGEWR